MAFVHDSHVTFFHAARLRALKRGKKIFDIVDLPQKEGIFAE